MQQRIKDQSSCIAAEQWLKANGSKPVKNTGLFHSGYSKNVKRKVLKQSKS